MSESLIATFKKNKAFVFSSLTYLIISIYNLLFADEKLFIRASGLLFFILFAIIYKLIDVIDNKSGETKYLSTINTEMPDNFKYLLEKSKNISILGIHLNSFLTSYHESIQKALHNGAVIKVIIVPLDSYAIRMTATRYVLDSGESKFSKENIRINNTHDILIALLKKYPDKVIVKEIDYLFEHELIILDDLAIDSRYNFGTKATTEKPKFFYKNGTEWYYFCQTEFSNHWKGKESRGITSTIPNGKR